MHSAAAMVTLTSLFSLSQEAGGSGTGTGLEPRLGTSAMLVSYPLIVPGWLLQLQPSQLCQGKKKGGLACVSYTYLFSQNIKTLPPNATVASCLLLISQKWPTVAVRDVRGSPPSPLELDKVEEGWEPPIPSRALLFFF